MTTSPTGIDVRAAVQCAWAGVAEAWEAHADEIDARTAAITERLLELAGIREGASVLELASGLGGVGIAAAERAGARGRVVISDVVPAMAEAAGRRVSGRGLTNVIVTERDLEDIAEPDGSFDAVLCREGLMFALDPAAAVVEMRRVLRPGGTIAVSVWADRSANPWLGLLFDAITEITGTVVPPPGVPGPFAIADQNGLHALFDDAGFTELTVGTVAVSAHAPSFDAWWARTQRMAGPAVAVLAALDSSARDRIRDSLRASTSQYAGRDGDLRLPGLALVVGGKRP